MVFCPPRLSTSKGEFSTSPDMFKARFADHYKTTIIGLGILSMGYALVNLPSKGISFGFLAVLAFAVLIAPRMTLSLPRSKFLLSFSDSVIFFTFLFYGGETAIVVAFIETFANCAYQKKRGDVRVKWFILFNSSLASLVTAIVFAVFSLWANIIGSGLDLANTRNLIVTLGFLALSQFFVASVLASVYRSIQTSNSLWETWKKECLTTSMAQLTGAGLAGITYKLFNYADPIVIGISFIGIGLLYLSYRQSIGEINSAIDQVEEAEKEKAETERTRRLEAEEFAGQLSISLSKEEQANKALRKSERDFQHAALHDSLTGLANRKQFGDVLRRLIADYKVDSSAEFQVLFLDIRSFKNINDTLGHTIGDKVLTIAAKRFLRMLDSKDVVARIGGDEFAIILKGLSSTSKAQKVARRIYQNITQPFSLSGNRISVDVNIGIAPCDAEYDTPEEILRDADIAMHYAKEKNNGLAVFTKELRARFLERVRFEMDLRHAIDRDELSLHYQPIISLSDGRLVGFEALLRWNHSEFGMIPPNKFIPIAESSGLIKPITVWILEEACGQISHWQKMLPEYRDLIISINISGKHLSDNDLVGHVENALQTSRVDPSTVKLEVTESAAMENPEHTINLLASLKKIGVQLSIDDFGTGYSSLSYLHRLPFDTLKIDRSFVNTVGSDGENSEILQTIISLAKNLKMRVVAEGIETETQLLVLQNLGCDYGQGFLIAKPKAREETETLLYQRRNWLPQNVMPRFDSVNQHVADEQLPVF
jgi:diguanylate cyclase (GGDEF)-like protein